MRMHHFTLVAVATIVFGTSLGSCNKNRDKAQPELANRDKAQPELAEAAAPQEQAAPPPMPAPASGGTMAQLRAGCPIVVQGVDVAVSDTEQGVALTFTTSEGDVGDLRARVQHMAQMYQMHRGHAGMMWHHMGGPGRRHRGMGPGHMAGHGFMPAASATVTNIDKGARLEIRPIDSSQLDALREHVRWHQQRMHSGECWMLQNQPATPPQGGQ